MSRDRRSRPTAVDQRHFLPRVQRDALLEGRRVQLRILRLGFPLVVGGGITRSEEVAADTRAAAHARAIDTARDVDVAAWGGGEGGGSKSDVGSSWGRAAPTRVPPPLSPAPPPPVPLSPAPYSTYVSYRSQISSTTSS